jgi:predicted esterase
VTVVLLLGSCAPSQAAERSAPAASGAAATSAAKADAGARPWCTEGLETLHEGTCFVIPESGLKSPRALLIYLHGVIAPGGDTQKHVQGIVARNARARGYVALMPRGLRGLGPPPVQDWWAWPTTPEAHARHARALTRQWLEAREALERRLGSPFARTYVAGSSNGAFFVAALALKGELAADGYGAVSGGARAGRHAGNIARTGRAPFYVGYGAHDDLKPYPIELGQLLREAGWPHRVVEHPLGHGAHEVYLDEAFAFWGGP